MNNHETPMTEYLQQIGQSIRTIREAHAMSHAALAEACGIDRAELSRIESGKRNVTINTLVRIAQALDCTLDVILTPR